MTSGRFKSCWATKSPDYNDLYSCRLKKHTRGQEPSRQVIIPSLIGTKYQVLSARWRGNLCLCCHLCGKDGYHWKPWGMLVRTYFSLDLAEKIRYLRYKKGGRCQVRKISNFFGLFFMQTIWRLAFLFFFLLTFYPQGPWAQEGKKSLLPLTIKGKTIKVEVARTEKEKEKGLMFRERLGKDEGMLFVYEGEEIRSFWMKNTRLPLSIAFIDKNGKIVDIQDMEPFSLQTHISAYPTKYVLEMNRGWFERNGIKVGDVAKIPSATQK